MDDHQSLAQLHKRDTLVGSILWLRKSNDKDDSALLQEAGLDLGAPNHPVLVIDVSKEPPSHVRICMVRKIMLCIGSV